MPPAACAERPAAAGSARSTRPTRRCGPGDVGHGAAAADPICRPRGQKLSPAGRPSIAGGQHPAAHPGQPARRSPRTGSCRASARSSPPPSNQPPKGSGRPQRSFTLDANDRAARGLQVDRRYRRARRPPARRRRHRRGAEEHRLSAWANDLPACSSTCGDSPAPASSRSSTASRTEPQLTASLPSTLRWPSSAIGRKRFAPGRGRPARAALATASSSWSPSVLHNVPATIILSVVVPLLVGTFGVICWPGSRSAT